MRRRLFAVAWRLSWPLRAYLRLTPAHRGRGLVEAALKRLTLPLAPEGFLASLPGGGVVELRYRERIGLSTLVYGSFEAAEIDLLRNWARPGSTVVDAGANVGLFTIPLALAVGERGRVLACEPAESNVSRLSANLHRNELANVDVVPAALGSARGTATLVLDADAAYHSVSAGDAVAGTRVPVERLDDLWARAGRPTVSVLKVDVEGTELDVLEGGVELLRACRPAVLVEAAETQRAHDVTQLMAALGYRLQPEDGVQPWNLFFVPAEGSGA
jgi:FkbM family methyltransferase